MPWQELDLKIAAINRLLHSPPPLRQYPSVNALWAELLIEELCRLGASTFCIAPGKSLNIQLPFACMGPCARAGNYMLTPNSAEAIPDVSLLICIGPSLVPCVQGHAQRP